MSKSEFRWNKKRKHYAYIHKNYGVRYLNILITSKPIVLRKGKKTIINIPLHHHPNKKKEGQYYVIPRNYIDNNDSFDIKIYDWVWDKNDKRKIKRVKNNKYYKKNRLRSTISANHRLNYI